MQWQEFNLETFEYRLGIFINDLTHKRQIIVELKIKRNQQ